MKENTLLAGVAVLGVAAIAITRSGGLEASSTTVDAQPSDQAQQAADQNSGLQGDSGDSSGTSASSDSESLAEQISSDPMGSDAPNIGDIEEIVATDTGLLAGTTEDEIDTSGASHSEVGGTVRLA